MTELNGQRLARKAVSKAKAFAAGLPQDNAPQPVPEAVALPLEVHEQDRKPQRAKTIVTSGVSKRTGKPYFMVTPAPGYQIARVVLTDLDKETRRCRTAVIAERRRGRPANSQRSEGKE